LSAAGGEPATVAVMAAMREKRLLGFRRQVPAWQTLPRDEGFRMFERAFLASPHRMIVVVPDFTRFSAKFRQAFVYLPLAAFDGGGTSVAEREFLRDCIERIRPRDVHGGEAADVVQLDGGCIAERKHGVGIEWTAPFEVILRSARLVSKRSCLEAIVPALRRGIGADEGGIYTPYGGDGIFLLISMLNPD
jgi:hypothetical protein